MIEEEHNKILRENQLLLRKMVGIDKRPSKHTPRNSPFILQSLNLAVTKKRYQDINRENFVLYIA